MTDFKALIDEARALLAKNGRPCYNPNIDRDLAPIVDRLATALSTADAELARESRRHTQTLEERDAVQDLFDELYTALFGKSPEYSNLFNAEDAFNEMDAEISRRKSALSTADADMSRDDIVEHNRRTAESHAAMAAEVERADAQGYVRGIEEAARVADASADASRECARRYASGGDKKSEHSAIAAEDVARHIAKDIRARKQEQK